MARDAAAFARHAFSNFTSHCYLWRLLRGYKLKLAYEPADPNASVAESLRRGSSAQQYEWWSAPLPRHEAGARGFEARCLGSQ